LLTRILTALPLIAGFLAALYLTSNTVWAVIMGLALFMGAMEWAMLAKLNKGKAVSYGLFLAVAGIALSLLEVDSAWVYLLSLAFWIAAPWLLHRGTRFSSPALMLGIGALVLLPTLLALVELHARQPSFLLAVVGLVVIADSAAYFAGRRFGRHKLAPSISPGKTWEGLAGAWLMVSLYALLLHAFWPGILPVSWLAVLLLSWSLLALSVVGDLFESWAKRLAGVKDSSHLLPGHGGVLDRIDSLTATLPAATLFYLWMQ